jgi:ABC-type antimicrobial peptide transport system permease subunit
MKIVGLVDNAREEGYASDIEPVIYACGFLRWLPDSDFLVQMQADPATFVHAIREAVHSIEPARAVYSVQTLSDALSDTLWHQRFRTKLLGGFSSIALILAAVGLYGVLAYMVAQRTREFGVRIALGATRAQIGTEIVRSAGPLIAAGLTSGIVVAAVVAKLMRSLLAVTSISDVAVYSSAAGVLLGAAALACVIPGRRATSISPTAALREQ